MNKLLPAFLLGIIIAAVIVMANTVYTVDEAEQVVVTQFGEPIGGPVTRSGLHFKMPFMQQVNRFDKRILEWDGSPNQIPTLDKRYIWVDTTARWKINDALVFMKAFGSEAVAQPRLDDIIDAATRDTISAHNLVEIIRDTNDIITRIKERPDGKDDLDSIAHDESALEPVLFGREVLTRDILKRARSKLTGFGIELIDVRIRRLNYVQDVLKKVFERMISERKRAAEQYRSIGQGNRAGIEGKMAKELEQIRSEAYRTAQEIIGKADAEATSIYADAYNRAPDFYAFLKTLETYRESMDANTTLMLSTDSDVFRLLKTLQKP